MQIRPRMLSKSKEYSTKNESVMSDSLRYRCQVALPGFGEKGQQKLQMAKVLIVGAGGLGCPAAIYLVSAGIGTVGIADFDVVSPTNLHRQVLYGPDDIGQKKAVVACTKLQQQNPLVNLLAHDIEINCLNVMEIIRPYDVILDATDNFETKYLLNDACVLIGKPLVYGAIYQYEGQAAIWNVAHSDGSYSPNYRDLFTDMKESGIPNCAEAGVLPTIAGIIGIIQANEVIKYLTNVGELLKAKLLVFDAETMQSRIIKLTNVTKTLITELPQSSVASFITAQELKNNISKDYYHLIDVRDAEEREKFHIGGEHVPLAEIEHHIQKLTYGKPSVFYCASGRRSLEAVKKISSFLKTKTFSLQGGLEAWKQLI